jgi:hypothetical protein
MVLSLVILVTIVSNIILWSYQMNQLDWEKMHENFEIISAAPSDHSSWFSTSQEYVLSVGSQSSGTFSDTQSVDDSFETFVESALTFEYGYAFNSSDVRVSTTSGIPVDDSQSILTVTLNEDSHVFIIYNAGNQEGSIEDTAGKGCAISINGEDKAFSWQSPYARDSANSVTVVYAVYLPSGSYTFRGRFFANRPGFTVGIDTRQILAYWFPQVVAQYVRSVVAVSTTSMVPVVDNEAVLNFNLTQESAVFTVYNVGNKRGSDEPQEGKGITLSIDGLDALTKQWQSGYGPNDANSLTTMHTTLLSPGSHTLRGKFFSNSDQETTIDERQFMVFCFPSNLINFESTESTNSVSTASGAPVNDTDALLTTTLSTTSNSLLFYIGGNPSGIPECREGKRILLNIDGSDKMNSSSWQSPRALDSENSVTSLWSMQLAAGVHKIQGKFSSNNANSSSPIVSISDHQLVIISFPNSSESYRIEIEGSFSINIATYPLERIQTLESQMRYKANSADEKLYIKAYNWSSSVFEEQGLNTTTGHIPSTEWNNYSLNFSSQWQNYVHVNGTVKLQIIDEGPDGNQTVIDIDFLAIRAVINGAEFHFQNKGPSTLNLVSVWINNLTHHQRYDLNVFLNSAETAFYFSSDIILPTGSFTVRVVTKRGNTVILS